MKPKKRQKLCYNCEGEVDLDVIVCPFCAADLRVEKPEQETPSYRSRPIEQLLPPLYPPQQEQVHETAIPPSESEGAIEEKTLIGPIVLLALGSHLLLLGIFLALFSQNGVVFLKWNARFWIGYVIASIPMLFFGYKALCTGQKK